MNIHDMNLGIIKQRVYYFNWEFEHRIGTVIGKSRVTAMLSTYVVHIQ